VKALCEILEELQRRKDAKEAPCDSCDGTGLYLDKVCLDCLGQGILLTKLEYETLLTVARRADDAILDQQVFD
jgi:DnaJ-class molecular chaperone